ncbi:MAG: hypothetical protein HY391_02500 [Deltaproteobacteria bacterium]|nr:hypothetical protein [Deltaproteobacteria bacterium]
MPTEAKVYRKRKQYFIKESVQGRYLRVLFVAIVAPTLLITACLLYLMFTLMANQMGIPENIHANLIPVMKQIGWILLFGLPVLIAALFWWGVIVSHRMAGPIFRLEHDLEAIAKGDFQRRIIFRKKDKLDSLANKFNTVLDILTAGYVERGQQSQQMRKVG